MPEAHVEVLVVSKVEAQIVAQKLAQVNQVGIRKSWYKHDLLEIHSENTRGAIWHLRG